MKSKEKRTTIKVMILIGVLVALILIISLADVKIPGMERKNDQWFADNSSCKCTASNRLTCSSGFELNNSICVNFSENTYTNPMLGCSLYNCSNTFYQFDKGTGEWKQKIK